MVMMMAAKLLSSFFLALLVLTQVLPATTVFGQSDRGDAISDRRREGNYAGGGCALHVGALALGEHVLAHVVE